MFESRRGKTLWRAVFEAFGTTKYFTHTDLGKMEFMTICFSKKLRFIEFGFCNVCNIYRFGMTFRRSCGLHPRLSI